MMAGLPIQQSMVPGYPRMTGAQVRQGVPMGNRSMYGHMSNNNIIRSQSTVPPPAAYTNQARNMPQNVNDLLQSFIRLLIFPSFQSRILLDIITMLRIVLCTWLLKSH